MKYGDPHPRIIPQQYIRDLYKNAVDNKISITYYAWDPVLTPEDTVKTYEMDCTDKDIEEVIKKYNELTAILDKLAQMHEELLEENNRKKMLTKEEQRIWDIFVKPFKPCDIGEDRRMDFYLASFDLDDEENEIYEHMLEWRAKDCFERLASNRRAPAEFVTAGKNYEWVKCHDHTEESLNNAEKELADAMILYYCAKEDTSDPYWGF